jgi:uncharacterized membrane protein YqhA
MRRLEGLFERALWLSRLMMLVAVASCVLLAFGVIYVTTVDVAYLLGSVVGYADAASDPSGRADARIAVVTSVVAAVDGYFIAAILLLVALGLYELYVNKIDGAESSQVGARLLDIRSVDDLKDRVAKLVLLALVVEFFKQALGLPYDRPLDLLYLGAGILLVGAALYLTGKPGPKEPPWAPLATGRGDARGDHAVQAPARPAPPPREGDLG